MNLKKIHMQIDQKEKNDMKKNMMKSLLKIKLKNVSVFTVSR